jgi:hypothetical protein
MKYGIMVEMVCRSASNYIYKVMIYDTSDMTIQETVSCRSSLAIMWKILKVTVSGKR